LIGIDANVVVRLLADDDPVQGEAAERALDGAEGLVRVDPVVLAEVGWVLRTRYRHSRAQIVAGLRAVVTHPLVLIEAREAVEAALDAYERGGAGFPDHLIGALNAAAGCRTTLTFDKNAAKGPHFTLLT
jgi:predicted nucleic-acid-binding protein